MPSKEYMRQWRAQDKAKKQRALDIKREKNRLSQQKSRQNKKLRAQATMSNSAPMPLGAAAKPNDNESTALPNPATGPYPEQRLVLTSQQKFEALRESRLRASASNKYSMQCLDRNGERLMSLAQQEHQQEAALEQSIRNAVIMDVENDENLIEFPNPKKLAFMPSDQKSNFGQDHL